MMAEVLDAEMKDECHIMLLVRRDCGDMWEDHGSILRVRRDIYDGLLDWVSEEEPPEWWEGKKNV
tara:strand:+ start:1817 stop:2011 length:195 start_codon:yes stop_codon:yes gene_type:complete